MVEGSVVRGHYTVAYLIIERFNGAAKKAQFLNFNIRAGAEIVGGRFVDGGIVGPPPRRADTTRLYLSGQDAPVVAALFAGTGLTARVVPDASALKMTYAAWTKGTTALLVAIQPPPASSASRTSCSPSGR